ncbi:alpha/beta fold hydrolase [Streptomyces jumonjinensis]|uniref:alpha/beta fold hydrolase n=1 Tax=Streptomyces jumonjinensis TaxID=1945 RepID=UPI0037ADCA48
MSAPRGPGSGENAAHQRVLAGPRGRHGRASRTAAGSAAAPAAARQVGLARRVNVRKDVAPLTIPTLVVVTTADAMVPPALQRQLATALTFRSGGAWTIEADPDTDERIEV